MLTNEQLNTLKNLLQEDKKAFEGQLDRNKDGSLEGVSHRDTVGELSAYDNHPADLGTELYEREKDFALEEHADSELDKVEDALAAIEDGSYGTCKVCGNDIPFERLEVVPSTLYCVDHTPEQKIAEDRPVEEDVLEPAHGNTFRHKQNTEMVDHEDSFQEVARYGTSETPSDLKGDYEDYGSLYNEGSNEEGSAEDYETFSATDITGKERKVYPSKKHEEYEQMLDNENLESPIGNIPYRRTDSYVDDSE